MLTKTKLWASADGPWKVVTTREQGTRVLASDDAGSIWQCYEAEGMLVPVADHQLAASVLTAMAADAAARAQAAADEATKRDDAVGAAVIAKLKAVAGGTGSLTQPQIAKLFLAVLNRL